MKILITGITGFAGPYLAKYIMKSHPEASIYGTFRRPARMDNINHIIDKIELIKCDLMNATHVMNMMKSIRPDYIFHLAAQSYVPASWHNPADTIINNVIGELNIFEAVRKIGINPLIQLACSSEEYGMVYEDELPIKETNPLRPLSPYGISKVAQDLLGYQYHASYGMRIIRTRAFSHSGPGRKEVFVESNFAKQIVNIEAGIQKPVIKVGNLDARRDYSDVRDTVRAYWLAVEKGEPGEVYNIASGNSYAIREILDILLSMTGLDIKIEVDPSRLRPSDVPRLVGDATKIRKLTGWKPEIPFEKTLEDILNYWREKIKTAKPE
ncbi:MAG: GDP-mannose 4,6-dehydratase [Candidatus Eremiobacteraeota bacterium]|nr:GDP-mannose 4,6-dehydratase [Candidatus Eremiobacteraeota bacterium]